MRTTGEARGARKALLAMAAALLVVATGAAPQDPPTGSWAMEANGDMFTQGAAASDGTYFYAIGGLQFGTVTGFPQMYQQLRRYDPAGNTWVALATLPVGVSDNAGAFLDGKLYSFGGSDAVTGEILNLIQCYDIQANTWTVLSAVLSSPRMAPAAAALGGAIYVSGGYDGNDFLSGVDRFDPVAGSVEPQAPMPAALLYHTMTAVEPNALYVASGFDAGGPVASMYAYNADSDSWSGLPAIQDADGLEQPRYGAASFAIQGRVYVTGGLFDSSDALTWEFNPAANTWARRADMNNARFHHGAAVIGGKGYVYGGSGVSTGEEFTAPPFEPEPPANHAPIAHAGADQTVEATGADGASVTLDGSDSSDEDGDSLTYAWSPINASGVSPTVTLPVGENVLTLTVSDGQATSTDIVVITVTDSEGPVIDSLTASPNQLWSPNHDMRAVTLTAVVSDPGDIAPECEIIDVSSNQPTGNEEDWVITGLMTVNLRAERTNGQTRVYTITVRCTDASGNSSLAETTVCVPHNQGGNNGAEAKKAKK